MKHLEKKYLVKDFADIIKRLAEVGAVKQAESISTHYYTDQANNDVVKLVEGASGFSIHELTSVEGKFELIQSIPLEDRQAGLGWLKNKGYSRVGIVKMQHTDYEYKDGLIGLYTINDFLYSIILDFPDGEHDDMEQTFSLNNAELINIPYNKYLEQQGDLEWMDINGHN